MFNSLSESVDDPFTSLRIDSPLAPLIRHDCPVNKEPNKEPKDADVGA